MTPENCLPMSLQALLSHQVKTQYEPRDVLGIVSFIANKTVELRTLNQEEGCQDYIVNYYRSIYGEETKIHFLDNNAIRIGIVNFQGGPDLQLPSNTQEVILQNSSNIVHLDSLPAGIKHISAFECPSFETISSLPEGLESLIILNCHKFRKLPAIPQSAYKVFIKYCNLDQLSEDRIRIFQRKR